MTKGSWNNSRGNDQSSEISYREVPEGGAEMMIRNVLLCTAFIAVLLTSGCSIFKDPNSPWSDKTGDNQIILMQADRRALFTFAGGKAGRACPEPSPDVRADVEAVIKGMFSGSAAVPQGISTEAKGELDATRKVLTSALIKRSQGLQVLRDLSFQACLANLRGDLPGPQYMTFLTITLPRLTNSLITTELLGSMTTDGKSLTKEVIEAIVKYQIIGLAQP